MGEVFAMLRIIRLRTDDAAIVLKLEGKLLEPWIDELRRSIDLSPSAVHLDLSALTFADAAGAQALADLLRHGVALTACSGFIATLLHVEKS
jgi:anti-anti-sigma regulatory factor